MLIFNIVYGILALISWSAFFYKLRDLVKDPGNREIWLLCLAIATFALPFVVASPWLYVRIDQALGVANIATLIIYTSVAICETSFLALLVSWSSAADRVKLWHRTLVAYAVITVATMITLFALGDVNDAEHQVDFDVTYSKTPYITEFLLIYFVLYVVGMIGLAFMCWRYAKAVDRTWLRRGLRVIATGAIFGLGYGIPKGASLVWDLLGTSPLNFVNVNIAPMCASVSAWLFAVGFTMPAWGIGVDNVHDYRAYRRLHPLWRALTHAFPEVVLFPELHPDNQRRVLRHEDLPFLVSRQVIEIRDGQLALRPYYDPAVADAARELSTTKRSLRLRIRRRKPGDWVEVVVEAAQIKAALRARDAGAEQHHAAAVPHDAADGDMVGEREWLIRVAKAYGRSKLSMEAANRTAVGTHARASTT